MKRTQLLVGTFVVSGLCIAMCTRVVAAQTPPAKADIVMISGCLKEQAAGTWRVTNATDPKPSNAVAPPASELPPTPAVGTRQFDLIGVAVFNLPAYKDKAVVVKGLLVPATPVSRLNITSIVTVAPTCPPPK